MKSNYKTLGQFIEPCDEKNLKREISDSMLRGISNQKYFQKAKTNTIGVDLSKYRIVRKGQFAFNRATTRNGDKISIALRKGKDCIVSPSYRIFRSKDENILNSEYLMMWFRRPEFDRYARFKSHGSAHEFFDYDEMCEVEIPVPSIEKQREIVAEYNTVTNRIKLNEQLNKKLEETAQALYKHWFVDNQHESWETIKLRDIVIGNPENLSNKDNFKTIVYLDTSNITNNKIDEIQTLNLEFDNIPSRAKRKVRNNDIVFSTVRPALKHFGILKNKPDNFIVSTGFAVLRLNNDELYPELIYSFLTESKILESLQAKAEMSVSTYPSITIDDILNLDFVMPDSEILKDLKVPFKTINKLVNVKNIENQSLTELKSVLLSKMSTVGDNAKLKIIAN